MDDKREKRDILDQKKEETENSAIEKRIPVAGPTLEIKRAQPISDICICICTSDS